MKFSFLPNLNLKNTKHKFYLIKLIPSLSLAISAHCLTEHSTAFAAGSSSKSKSSSQNGQDLGEYATNEVYRQIFKSISKSKFGLATRFEGEVIGGDLKLHEFALYVRTALEQDLTVDLGEGLPDVPEETKSYIPVVHAGLKGKVVMIQVGATDPTKPNLLKGTMRFKEFGRLSNASKTSNQNFGLIDSKVDLDINSKSFAYKNAKISGVDFEIHLPSAANSKSKADYQDKVLSMIFDCKAETAQLNRSMTGSDYTPLDTCRFKYDGSKNSFLVDVKEQVPEWAK